MRDKNSKGYSGYFKKESYLIHQVTQNHEMAGGARDLLEGTWSIHPAQAGTCKDSYPGLCPGGI